MVTSRLLFAGILCGSAPALAAGELPDAAEAEPSPAEAEPALVADAADADGADPNQSASVVVSIEIDRTFMPELIRPERGFDRPSGPPPAP